MNKRMDKFLYSPLARTAYLPILALALLAGCSNSSTESPDASSSDAGGPGFSMQGGEQGDEEMIPKEVLARARRVSRTVTGPLYMLEIQYAHDTISAEELYKGARDIIEKAVEDEAITGNEAIPSYAIEFVIPKLLDHLLRDDNASPEGVGYFTDMLMSMESPNADMILEALHRLDGYWTEAHIRTVAREAIRNAEKWLSHTDEGASYRGKNRPAIVASIQHLQRIASL